MSGKTFRPPGILLCALAVGVACAPRAEERLETAEGRRPSVFIISIDTLRSDRIGAYGYRSGSTPSIDAFRNDAILFSRAFSNCPQTLPSHSSILTGMLPPGHGVRDNIGYSLAPSVPTLQETLKHSGYSTGAAVSSYVLRRATGLSRGFDFYDDHLDYDDGILKTSAERGGERTRIALEQWMDSATTPLFALLHLYEPHAPYRAPPEFARTAADPYDAEVSYADAVVGRFLAGLKSRGLYDGSLIVVLSDHGEGLGDHGEMEHGLFLYRESIQVPLLIKLPGAKRRGETVENPAGLHDVAPTILRYLGITQPETMEGSDLLKPLGNRRIYSESWFARLHFGWHELRSLIGSRYHYIEAPSPELFLYGTDPGEARNLATSERRELFRVANELKGMDSRFSPPGQVDPEDQRRLESLGYIGSGGTLSSGHAPDPKEKLGIFRDLQRGFLLVKGGRFKEAIPLLRRLIEGDPDLSDGWWLLSQSLRGSGRGSDAKLALTEAMKRFPKNANIALEMADLLAAQGDFSGARRHAELVLETDPLLAHEFLARMELKRGRLDAAEREARAASAAAPGRTESLALLAEVLRAARRPAEELKYLDLVRQEIARRSLPPMRRLEFHRGEALLAVGRVADAAAAFRREIDDFPQTREAWSSLALVLGAEGKREQAREVLLRSLRENPDREMFELALESMEVMKDREGMRRLEAMYIPRRDSR